MNDDELALLDRKAARMAQARRRRSDVWRQVAHAGTLGLLLVLPTVVGAAIGRAVTRSGGGRHAALVGLLVGLALGAALVVLQVRASLRHARAASSQDHAPPPHDHEETPP